MTDSFFSSPSSLCERTTQWFERAKASLLDTLPCTKGCSNCCTGLFTVTILDRQELQRGLSGLPKGRRTRIEETASTQAAMLTAMAPQLTRDQFIDEWPEEKIDRLITRFDRWPCPALESDGSCGIYEFRPLVCRSMGMPCEEEGSVTGACTVQTAVPLIRLSKTLRDEENQLAAREAKELEALRDERGAAGEELFLPFAFLPESYRSEGSGSA